MSQPHDETLETRRNTAQPDEPAAWVQRGSAQLAVGDFDAAVISFSHGLALAPRMFVARLQLGMAQEQLGQSHAALKRSEEHTSELQSLMRISYAVFCLKKNKHNKNSIHRHPHVTATLIPTDTQTHESLQLPLT